MLLSFHWNVLKYVFALHWNVFDINIQCCLIIRFDMIYRNKMA